MNRIKSTSWVPHAQHLCTPHPTLQTFGSHSQSPVVTFTHNLSPCSDPALTFPLHPDLFISSATKIYYLPPSFEYQNTIMSCLPSFYLSHLQTNFHPLFSLLYNRYLKTTVPNYSDGITSHNVDNQNIDKPKRRQLKMSTNQHFHNPIRRQTKTLALQSFVRYVLKLYILWLPVS